LPTMTSGWRARRDGRVGCGMRSGSSLARALRGCVSRSPVPSRPIGAATAEVGPPSLSLGRVSSAVISRRPFASERPRRAGEARSTGQAGLAAATAHPLQARCSKLAHRKPNVKYGERVKLGIRRRSLHAPQYQRRIGASKPERIGKHHVDIAFLGLVGNQIDR
jgi:hypothetical protein